MNDMTIGMENLPNVFIEKITVSDAGRDIKVTVKVSMYDHKRKPRWRNIKGLKIKLVFESDLDRISSLNQGSRSLYDYEVDNRNSNFIIPCETLRLGSSDGDYDQYVGIVEEIFLQNRVINLNVYAACLIDDLGFNNDIFDKFYGPMVGERIFVSRRINPSSNYFYYPDTNEEYGGPVHQKADGNYMEGSEHSISPHRNVVMVSEGNYKIQSINYETSTFGTIPSPQSSPNNLSPQSPSRQAQNYQPAGMTMTSNQSGPEDYS